jgi:hypothetical protein
MQAALDLLVTLLRNAVAAGFASSTSSLGSSIRQQLQQSGMLTQLSALMAAMAADTRAEAAAIAAGGSAAASVDTVNRCVSVVSSPVLRDAMMAYSHMLDLWLPWAETLEVGAIAWLCAPSSPAIAAMQLHTAALQHVSAVVQHVLPAVRQRDKQQADALLHRLSAAVQDSNPAHNMIMLVASMNHALSGVHGSASDSLVQLLLSPHVPCHLATVLVMYAFRLRQARTADSHAPGAAMTHSSSGGPSSNGGGTALRQSGNSSSSTSSSSRALAHAPAACELQLLELLGLAPEVLAWLEPQRSLEEVAPRLTAALMVCTRRCEAVLSLASGETSAARQPEPQLLLLLLQQQWRVEQQLWLLLPTVVLPGASCLVSASGQALLQQHSKVSACVRKLLEWSWLVFDTSRELQKHETLGGHAAPIPAAWGQELLGVVLQLADQLLDQQTHAATETATATPGATSSNSSSSRESQLWTKCTYLLLPLLSIVAERGWDIHCQPSSIDSNSDSSNGPAAAAEAAAVPPVAARFVEFVAAVEGSLRAVIAVGQGGVRPGQAPLDITGVCYMALLCFSDYTEPTLVKYMGMCGAEALAQEQRQLYSLLSTMLKLGRCYAPGAESFWDERVAGSCCFSMGHAAVK